MSKKEKPVEKIIEKTKVKEKVATVAINGVDYQIDKLSDTVKNLLSVYNQWQADREKAINALGVAKLEIAKNEAALRDLSQEIINEVEGSGDEKNPE